MTRTANLFVMLHAMATLLIAATALPAFAVDAAMQSTSMPQPRSIPLSGALTDKAAWRAYKARFVTEQGRVVDTGNASISHSEGQGYGLLLAVAANDRDAFEKIWGWTRANLMVRGDELMAWRWEPDARPAVADMNNASDGDLLVAWALAEAGEAWSDASYRVAARRIAVELGRKLILPKTPQGALLLPAVSGFAAEDRADGPVINLSYWVFPALERLSSAASEFDWTALTRSGLQLLERARFGAGKLPVEWVGLREAEAKPAQGFAATFSYNAIRIPLYLAWAGLGTTDDYAPFLSLWAQRSARGLPIVDTADGRSIASLGESGYAAIADLTACAARGTRLPASFHTVRFSENYYPVTLHMFARIAVQMRYQSCLNG
jgi:endoglucanase